MCISDSYDALLTVPELELEGALVYLTNYLFWEIDELLRSDEPEVVEWALYLAELVPFQYYIDSLKMVAKRDDELAQKALELISRANQELIYLPRADPVSYTHLPRAAGRAPPPGGARGAPAARQCA